MKYIIPLVSLFLLFCFTAISLAQTEIPSEELEVMESTESAETTPKVDESYDLPYPGLLPDSPFYFLKTFRDRIVSLLITDAKKKAEFNILQADKRLQAGVMLVQKSKDKYNLTQSTISKGENYFEQAIVETQRADTEGLDVNDLKSKLGRAVNKHKAVIADIEKKAPDSEKEGFTELLKRMDTIQKEVSKLQAQN